MVTYFRVVDGTGIAKGDKVKFLATGKTHDITEVGVMVPERIPVADRALKPGEVGYFVASIKSVDDARVGDTVTVVKSQSHAVSTDEAEPLPGYAEATPMVFAGVFPTDADQYNALRDAFGKLKRMTLLYVTRRRTRRPWASGSGAASWDYCTWRSSRSGRARV